MSTEVNVGEYRIAKDGIGRYVVQRCYATFGGGYHSVRVKRELEASGIDLRPIPLYEDMERVGFFGGRKVRYFKSEESAKAWLDVLEYERKREKLVSQRTQVWP